ncbi:MAG: DUF2442 domain-containing protein [Sedimentisphaerales bacterium]
MEKIPKVVRVQAEANQRLRVLFDNGIEKWYNCQQLMDRPEFDALKNESLFRLVHVDPGGYGISWNADIDLSEYELWTRGVAL